MISIDHEMYRPKPMPNGNMIEIYQELIQNSGHKEENLDRECTELAKEIGITQVELVNYTNGVEFDFKVNKLCSQYVENKMRMLYGYTMESIVYL